jgi:hypothetical protein
MKHFVASVDDELDEKFRKAVGMKYGQRKGVLSKAFAEALEMWIEHVKEEEELELKTMNSEAGKGEIERT